MIQGITSLPTLYQKYLSPSPSVGRMAFPVKPALSSFAVFKHIMGVPSMGTGAKPTIPIYKLRILDSMIDRIINMKKGSAAGLSFEKLNTEKVDKMIVDLQQRISESSKIKSYSRGIPFDAGSIINLIV